MATWTLPASACPCIGFAGTIRRNKHRDDRAHGRLQNPLAQNDVRAGEPSRRWEARWNKWKGHAPYHPQTQGKIERWHQTLKNWILLENYYLPGDLENQIIAFVDHYNNQRYHESIGNVTPADAYFGRHTAIIEKRKRIKKLTTQNRRLNHQSQAA